MYSIVKSPQTSHLSSNYLTSHHTDPTDPAMRGPVRTQNYGINFSTENLPSTFVRTCTAMN